MPVDLLGDWREELLEFTDKGELRIHVSAIPAVDRRVCLMQDPIYRRDTRHVRPGLPSAGHALVLPGSEIPVQAIVAPPPPAGGADDFSQDR